MNVTEDEGMELTVHEAHGRRFLEGPPGEPVVERVEEVITLLEACFEHEVDLLLLYPENLTQHFFDLSSGEAGEILQKLRNYRVRLTVARSPALRLSSRFGELLAEENDRPHFRIFDDRAAALEWLCSR
jgi:hypothetical protein